VKVRQEEEQEDKLVQDQAGRLGHLGVKGKPLSAQEQEATKDDDAEIPYHLWKSQLTRLWDSQLYLQALKTLRRCYYHNLQCVYGR
jgi:hypothetical protein